MEPFPSDLGVPVELALSRADRRRGLLGRDGYEGVMVFPRTRQIHTFGMRFIIDVGWCDRSGTVVRTARIAPNRLSARVRRAQSVLEAEVGTFARLGIATGDRVVWRWVDEAGATSCYIIDNIEQGAWHGSDER